MGKGRAGHRAWPSRPLQLSLSPLSPPRGNSRPPPHQAVGRRRARAFLCTSPVTRPASFPSALGQGRRRPFPLPQGPAPPLLILARCFLSRSHVLSFSVHRLPLFRFTDLFGRRPALQSPGSRRGVAPFRLIAPPAASISPALPAVAVVRQGRASLRFAPPLRPLGIRTRPPRRGSLPASGAGLTTAARRQARPSGILYFSIARSRQTSLRSDCRSSGVAAGSATA